jgi:hypothetical protein
MLVASGEAGYISEPLNVLHRPGVMRAPVTRWYPYICAENEIEYLPALSETFRFNYHTWAEISELQFHSIHWRVNLMRMARDRWAFWRGKIYRQRPLSKDPFALFSIPWFIQRLGCQVVVTVRHPAAFASSLKRLNWPFDFRDLLAQPLLVRDLLHPYTADLEALLLEDQGKPDVIAQASWLWRIAYQVVADYKKQFPEIKVVRHEDLSLDPLEGFRSLYTHLDLNLTEKAQEKILSSSSSENPQELSKNDRFGTRLNSRANLDNWKRRLEAQEIERIHRITQEVARQYYPDWSWD